MSARDTTSSSLAVWLALFAGPTAWSVHELVSYALVKVACESGASVLLHLLTLAALTLAGAGAYVAQRERGRSVDPPRGTPDLLAWIALLGNVLFGFAILMEAVPNAVVSPCL